MIDETANHTEGTMRFNEDFFYSTVRKRGETVEAVCARAGVSVTSIRNWSNGRNHFNPGTLERIAVALNVNPFDLITVEGHPDPLMDAPVTT